MTIRIGTAFATLLVVFSVMGCDREPQVTVWTDSLPATVEKIKPCVVPLVEAVDGKPNEYEIRATAFFIHRDGLLLTAAHVLAAGDLYAIYQGGLLPVQVVVPQFQIVYNADTPGKQAVHKWDIAAISVDKANGPYPCVQLSKIVAGRQAERIAMHGFMRGGSEYGLAGKRLITSLTTEGTVSGVFNITIGNQNLGNRLVLDITTGSGGSGSPVFDAFTGNVIGVISEAEMHEVLKPPAESPGTTRVSAGLAIADPVVFIEKWLGERAPSLGFGL